jgi:hypothetical protein
MTLLKADKAAAPRSFFEHWDTLRAMTAGRKARSAALLVGSTVVGSSCTSQKHYIHVIPVGGGISAGCRVRDDARFHSANVDCRGLSTRAGAGDSSPPAQSS